MWPWEHIHRDDARSWNAEATMLVPAVVARDTTETADTTVHAKSKGLVLCHAVALYLYFCP